MHMEREALKSGTSVENVQASTPLSHPSHRVENASPLPVVVKERERMIKEKENMEEEEIKTIGHKEVQTKKTSKEIVVQEVDTKE